MSRRLTIAPIAALLVAASVQVADAGVWYYEWSCAGECSPHQLTISGREGPFLSREDCDYARDRDPRADEFVRQGNLGGLSSCEEKDVSIGVVTVGPPAPAGPPAKVRVSAIEVGLALGAGWQATEQAMVARGAATVGIDLEQRTGRDVGGGAVQLGLHRTWISAPMFGDDGRAAMVLPFSVGVALTPQVYRRGARSVRLDLGASAGGLIVFGCSGCAAPVFDEIITFGYTLKAGVDVFSSAQSGVGVDLIFPSWRLGSTAPGDLLLESPAWMLRLSIVARPGEP